jgi:hypothetical protein
MKTIELWFYDALTARKHGKKLSKVDALILLRSKLTHAEICFVDRGRAFFTSTKADGAGGCRMKYGVDKNPERWQVIRLTVSTRQEYLMWGMACGLAGVTQTRHLWTECFTHTHDGETIYKGDTHKKYDTAGLLSFALQTSDKKHVTALRNMAYWWMKVVKWFEPDEENRWCSEAVADVLVAGGFSISPTTISPQKLYELMEAEERMNDGTIS